MPWLPTSPAAVAFWTGAGISRDAPTCGPFGATLTRRALDNYFSQGLAKELAGLYAQLEVPNAEYRPRLETVLDALTEVYGVDGLADVLRDLVSASPNAHHEYLARIAAAGARLITANFDTCIERSAPIAAGKADVVHFHGALGPGTDLSTLGARLRVIENGFPQDLKQRLDVLLGSSEVSSIAFLGYSGADFFDATRYLLDRLDLLSAKTVVWHAYDGGPLVWGKDPGSVRSDLLAKLVNSGQEVLVVSGTLTDLFAHLSTVWSLPRPRAVDSASAPDWVPTVDRPDELRRRATATLFARMGYRTGVIRTYDAEPPAEPREHEALAAGYWGAGRYSAALRAWERAFRGKDPTSRARLAERRGAVLWIRGRLTAAERHLWKAIQEWCSPTTKVAPEAQAVLLETYGRVIQHMRRLPDARWFERRRRIDDVVRRLRDLRRQLDGREGVALRATLANVEAALLRERDVAAADHSEAFAESEALNSWLNYEHARLRDRASQAESGEPPPARADYERQQRRETVIGATADHARVFLIPGAAAFFRVSEFREAFRPVEMTQWHRMRLTAGFAIQRLAAQRRNRRRGPTAAP